MDQMSVIQITVISFIFIAVSLYALINIIRTNGKLKREETQVEPKRKILKRKDSNIYDLKTSRRQK